MCLNDVSIYLFFCSQHTLVTEIRELIFPEDRTRYDELVYRRNSSGKTSSRMDYYDPHRVSVSRLIFSPTYSRITSAFIYVDERAGLDQWCLSFRNLKLCLAISIVWHHCWRLFKTHLPLASFSPQEYSFIKILEFIAVLFVIIIIFYISNLRSHSVKGRNFNENSSSVAIEGELKKREGKYRISLLNIKSP